MDEIKRECDEVVQEVSEKFGYNSIDKRNCESLVTVLKNVVFVMCKDKIPEERQLLFQVLRNTPIILVDDIDQEKNKELLEKYIGNPNPHIVEVDQKPKIEATIVESGKTVGEGAFVCEPIISQNNDITGKKGFIYVRKVDGDIQDFYKTDINVSLLIHELGHAWNSEKDTYTITEDGMLKERVGAATYLYSLTKSQDGKTVKTLEDVSGIILEEGMNTVEEEKYLAKYLGLSSKEMKEAYDTVLVKTAYQGYISDFVRSMLEELGEVDFTRWRMHGDMRSKAKIEELMQETDFWKNKKNANATSYLKKEIIERSCKRDTDVNNFFQENMSVYFPDDSKFTPLAKIDNSLRQYYDVKASSTCNLMGIEDFSQFFRCIENENMPLINEASLIKSKSAIRSCVSHATITGITGIKNDLEHLQNKGQGKEI